MAAAQMRFRRMTNTVVPSEISSLDIPIFEQHTTQIYKGGSGEICWRFEDEENRHEHPLIARLNTYNFTCVLEHYVGAVTVEPLLPDKLLGRRGAKGVTIPASEPSRQSFIYLRSNDTVHFMNEDFKITLDVDFEKPKSASQSGTAYANGATIDDSDAVTSEIQVRSSHVESPRGDLVEQDEDTESDDDEDEKDLTHTPAAPDATPATSRPTEPTVKETPNHNSTTDLFGEENELFSTAQNMYMGGDSSTIEDKEIDGDALLAVVDLNDTSNVGDGDSPSPLVQKSKSFHSQNRLSQSTTTANIAKDSMPAAFDSDDENEIPIVKMVKTTYGNSRSWQSTPQKGRRSAALTGSTIDEQHQEAEPNDPVDGLPEVNLEGADIEDDDDGNDQYIPLTSDPPSIHSLARVVAERTRFEPTSKKRQHTDDVTDPKNEDSTFPEHKKPRLQIPEEADDEEVFAGDGLMVQDEEPALASKSSKGKLKKPTRPLTQDSGENIVVAPSGPSPEVVINRQAQSETPSSTPSTLTGKVPKILLSSESAVHKNAPLKKWIIKMGASIIDNVPSKRTHFVCVVPKEHSLKSAKVLHSLAMDKRVVTDEWLIASKKEDELLDYLDFVHDALESTATHQRDRIFANKRLFFTAKLVKSYKNAWSDIQAVAKEAGAMEVDKAAFDKASQFLGAPNVVFFGADSADEDVPRVLNEYSRKVYSRDLFTHSIISGELALEEKKYELTAATPTPAKKGRRS